jgi:uncharacterized lipoprotein YddW (UPF0748 family)
MKRRDWLRAAAAGGAQGWLRGQAAVGGFGRFGALASAGAGAMLSGCGSSGLRIEPGAPPYERAAPGVDSLPREARPPALPREFRAAWIATVANIDWPSRPGLRAAQMQAEALAILDRARELGLNALVLQVRPAGDAIFPSTLEPWCEFLGGAQGRPPWQAGEAPWDPLAFWIEHAHARGLALHAWFNPYRARHSAAKSPLAQPHLGLRRPELVKTYGDMLWADPGEPAAAEHLLAVVTDVLRRYAVDGVHIDDYFYPYPVNGPSGAELPFPDDAAFSRHRAGGGTLARDDWRRANVDSLVRELYRVVHETRPGTLVGISPFGLGRPDRRPAGVSGFSQYDKLYADVERWQAEGWLDYLAPQLYWPIDRAGQPFPVLLDYWLAQNTAGRHVWPGLFTSQVVNRAAGQPLGPRAWPASELLAQVGLQRASMAGALRETDEVGARMGAALGLSAEAAAALPQAVTPGVMSRATPGVTSGSSRVEARGANAGATGHLHFSMIALMQDRDGIATALQAGPYRTPALLPLTPWIAGEAPPGPRLQRGPGGPLQIDAMASEAPRLWAVWRLPGDAASTSGAASDPGPAFADRWQFHVLPGAERQLAIDGAEAVVVHAVDALGRASAGAVWWPGSTANPA